MAVIHGRKPPIFGIPLEMKPIEGLPSGKIRLRLRPSDFAKVFVKTDSGIIGYHLRDNGDKWSAIYPFGVNQRITIENTVDKSE